MKFASIFEQIADAFLVIDGSGHVTFVNGAAAQLIGRPADQLIGHPMPADHPNALPIHTVCASAAKSRQSAHRRALCPTRQQWFELRATPAGDSIVLFCWQSQSPSDDSAAHDDRLDRYASQLSETVQELESLSYTVSHDLRAPLRHIEAFAGLLEQNLAGKLDAASAEYLEVISQSARQMSKLLEGVLSYSRLCRRELHRTPVQLDNALKTVLQELKLETEGRKIDWHIQSLPEVHADPWMIRETLARLISNALKFTRTRDAARISIRADSTPDEIILCIEDNGIGFDMQYANRLFGLFQRLHSDPQFEGTGVGLAHVRRMIQRHGGRVWAEAKPDSGATFFIAFPRAV